jgi:hypothetical protein
VIISVQAWTLIITSQTTCSPFCIDLIENNKSCSVLWCGTFESVEIMKCGIILRTQTKPCVNELNIYLQVGIKHSKSGLTLVTHNRCLRRWIGRNQVSDDTNVTSTLFSLQFALRWALVCVYGTLMEDLWLRETN